MPLLSLVHLWKVTKEVTMIVLILTGFNQMINWKESWKDVLFMYSMWSYGLLMVIVRQFWRTFFRISYIMYYRRKKIWFEMTLRWVNDDRFFIFGWQMPGNKIFLSTSLCTFLNLNQSIYKAHNYAFTFNTNHCPFNLFMRDSFSSKSHM